MLVKAVILLALAALGSSTDEMSVYDTIIVGMGAAGCTAASVLCKAGKRVLALEAQNRVGGRVNTVPFGSGVVELGAEWIHGSRNSRVYDLAIQNNVTILSQDVSFQVYRSDGTMPDKEMINDLVNYALDSVDDHPEEPEPLGQYITRKLMEYMASKYPSLLEDKDFIEQFLHFMDLVVNNYEASNSWNDITTHSKYTDLEGDLHLSWHKNGYKTLFEILLNTYRDGPGYPNLNLQLEKVVTKINYPQDPAQDVEVTCKDGSTYKARNVIVTVSLGVLKESYESLFSPQLPSFKVDSIERITIGVVGKIILDFEKIWWDTSSGLHGFLWSDEAANEISYEDRWIRRIEGFELKMGSNTSICLWTAGDVTKLKMGKTIHSGQREIALKVLNFFEEEKKRGLFVIHSSGVYNQVLKSLVAATGISLSTITRLKRERKKIFYRYTTLFYPPLPDVKAAIIDTMSIGVVDKIVLLFDDVWWSKDPGFNGFVWSKDDMSNVPSEDSWVTTIFAASSPMGCNKALTLWTSGRMGKTVETLPEDVVKRKSMELIRRFMGKNKTIPEPIDMLRSTWYANPFTRGSYTYDNLQTPLYPNAREVLAEPLVDSSGAPRVLFAGEATDSHHFSTVHGATDTGHREATRLLPKGKL